MRSLHARRNWSRGLILSALLATPVAAMAAQPGADAIPAAWPWWMLPIAFFGLTCLLGVLAVLAGIGGGVLFVPIVSGFAPWVHIDFVRGAGLMVALAGALSAGPTLVRQNLVNVRLAIPFCLVASIGSVAGALIGLALPVHVVQLTLGAVILLIAVIMTVFRPALNPSQGSTSRLAGVLGIEGSYWDPERNERVDWRPKSMGVGLVLFSGVGLMAGIFGLGAGWANVPVLNLVMGVPLKIAVATSYFLLAITDTAAVLIYLYRGALLPLVIVPSVLGITVGARVGTWLLLRTRAAVIRRIVIGVLLLAGVRALLRGIGI